MTSFSIFLRLQTPKPVPGPVTKREVFLLDFPTLILKSSNLSNNILFFSSFSSKSRSLKVKL